MGLTPGSAGLGAVGAERYITGDGGEFVVALAGNPNVGKSTLFNALTGMNQHTGNWAGKTVACARGGFSTARRHYRLVDIPGCYSLLAHSTEEEVARDFICFGGADAVAVVCDAGCLERNLNLVLQILEIRGSVLVCVNLLDEAGRRGIRVDLDALSAALGVPAVGTVARNGKTLSAFAGGLDTLKRAPAASAPPVRYAPAVEAALGPLEAAVGAELGGAVPARWAALRLLEGDGALLRSLKDYLGRDVAADPAVAAALSGAWDALAQAGYTPDTLRDEIATAVVHRAEEICRGAVRGGGSSDRDRRLDRIFTSRVTGFPVMLLLLGGIMWLTIQGANYPSALLSDAFSSLEAPLTRLLAALGAPAWLQGALVQGAYRVLAWVVSVMLPPMAIFFPLFTLLEDAGYLPRVAYNLDRPFHRCRACGKQSLTLCMGFGCNAAGVVGCRIIDSPRERLLAVLTNNFAPCNGRFPALIVMLTLFFAGSGALSSLGAAGLLTGVILIGVAATFLATRLLSATVLRGVPSSFTIEMPPYRAPQVGRVIVRSIFDRTLFVLGRAAAVAAPAGLLLWGLANLQVGGISLMGRCTVFLDPVGRLMGLDGVILLAFLLGFPANEIVLPIIVMAYVSGGTLKELGGLAEMKALLVANGWTAQTAVCFVLFSLMHWPCSTTLLTIRRETGSAKWTALAAALPTAMGFIACVLVHWAAGILQ